MEGERMSRRVAGMLLEKLFPKPSYLLWILVAGLASISLRAKDDRYEWPAIAPEEFATNEFTGAPGAHAVILFREVRADDIKGEETHYYRIKVLSDEGKKYADVEIPY